MDSTENANINAGELAELSALADDTLEPARRATVEHRISSSPQLRDLYERERRAVTVMRRAAATERAPGRLRARIEGDRLTRGSVARRRTLYGGSLAAALGVVLLLLLLVLPSGTPGAPSVSEAAALAVRGSTSAAPAPDPRAPATKLSQNVQHVYFPNWSIRFGWAAVGQRIDHLAGRRVVTVYYQGHGTNVAYTIVAGSALAQPAGRLISRRGLQLRTLSLNGRLVVTWRRGGHTCVLSGMGVTANELQRLAAGGYRYDGRVVR